MDILRQLAALSQPAVMASAELPPAVVHQHLALPQHFGHGQYPFAESPAAVLQLWHLLVQQQQAQLAQQSHLQHRFAAKPLQVPTEVTAELANAANLPQLLAALRRANPRAECREEDDKPTLRLPSSSLREANASAQGAFKEVFRPVGQDGDNTACSSGKDSKDSLTVAGTVSPSALPPPAAHGEAVEAKEDSAGTSSDGAPGMRVRGGVLKCAKEKNRQAQRRFRERQKGLITALKERADSLAKLCEEQKRTIEDLRLEVQELKMAQAR